MPLFSCLQSRPRSLALVAASHVLLALALTAGFIALAPHVHFPADEEVVRTANALGMKTRWSGSSLALYTHPDFPNVDEFTVGDSAHNLILQRETERNGGFLEQATHSAVVVLGGDSSLRALYSVEEQQPTLNEVRLTINGEMFVDFDVDGAYDLRVEPGPRLRRVRIWYEGGWHPVATEGALRDGGWRLKDGTNVRFEVESGRWIEASEVTGERQEGSEATSESR